MAYDLKFFLTKKGNRFAVKIKVLKNGVLTEEYISNETFATREEGRGFAIKMAGELQNSDKFAKA